MNSEPKKILVIEDEDTLRSALETKLKKEGYNVTVARDGEEGYKKIKGWKPDLILLDIILPKVDGYEVLEKMSKEKVKIPVIIVSNSGQPVELERTKKLGAVDHLIKTEFDPAEVITKVKAYLNQKEDALENKTVDEEIKPRESEDDIEKLGIKVLIVEDDHFLREICAKKLVKEGFTVFEAIDGERALKEIEKMKPDIVLLDIILPAIDGFEVLKKIRSYKNEKMKKTPIIMLSNLGQKDDIKKAMDLGADSYLIKAHFTTEEIVEKIKEVLSKKKH